MFILFCSYRRQNTHQETTPKPYQIPIEVVCRAVKQWVNKKTFDYLLHETPLVSEAVEELGVTLDMLELEDSNRKKLQNAMKVCAFYSGRMEYKEEEKDENQEREKNDEKDLEALDDTNHYYFPLSDAISQKALRKNIVCNYLLKHKK